MSRSDATLEKASKIAKNRSINRKTIKRLLSYIGHYRPLLILVGIAILISSAVNAGAALFLQVLIDQYIAPLLLESAPDFSGLFRALTIMGMIYLIGILSALTYNLIMVRIAQGTLKRIRDDMFTHMQELPIRYFDKNSHGDIMSHYSNDIDTLRQMITQSLPQFMSSATTILAVLLAMLYLSFWLTILAVGFVFLVLKVVRYIAGNSQKHFIARQRSLGAVNGHIEEMIHGLKVIKVFNHEEKAKEEFNRLNDELAENTTAANTYANILMPIMNNLGYVLYVLLAIFGGMMAIFGITNISFTGVNVVTLGIIASFLQLSRSFIMPIAQVSQQLNFVIMALAGAERIFEHLDEIEEKDHGTVTLANAKIVNGDIQECHERTGCWTWKEPLKNGESAFTPLEGDVRLLNVDFLYVEGDPVLHDITFYAKPGQKVALVGATGAGKTTITNLINRFYDISSGTILYDGIDIKTIRKKDLRRSLGIVLQDVHLFSGTVMDNIRYGRLDATDEECMEAASLANADSFIRMLDKGYETVLTGDGDGLSQGQRQLLSIARAAVADPPVMILDEATSSIDTRTEALVQAGMDRLMEGRTVFVIAHRLSTVRNSDVIMVLEKGKIIERGSHESLITQHGKYYQLYTGAFELQ